MEKRNVSSCFATIAGEPQTEKMESYINYLLKTIHSLPFPIKRHDLKSIFCLTSCWKYRSQTEESRTVRVEHPQTVGVLRGQENTQDTSSEPRELQSPENYRACCSSGQNSSRNLGGWSMPKNEEGFPCTSRSLFTKAVNEETQFPMKWSDWPRMYKSI